MRRLTICRRVTAFLFMALLSACSGGNGGNQASTSVSTNSITFSVASPDATTPSSQSFSATVSAGTIFVVVQHNGAAIANASYTLSGTTVQVVVDPPSPASLGAGDFTGTVTVTGFSCGDPTCSRPVTGNMQIVNVTYQIAPIVRFVAPYVAPANTPGTVVIRGQGFQRFSVTGVTFGTTAATTFTVISDTQIEASYPALSAGATGTTYPVQIQAPSSPGTITSQANLVAVNAPGYTTMTISYPSGTPQVNELIFDAERQALLVADAASGEVLRYAFNGGTWSTSQAIAGLSDIALATDGQHLLALSQANMYQLIADSTLASDLTTPAPTFGIAGTVLKNLAVGNDGNAVVTTGNPPSTSTGLFVYSACNAININTTCTPAFSQPASAPTLDNSTAVGSSDGSLIAIMHGDSTLTSPPSVFQYVAASDTFYATSVTLNQYSTNPVAPAVSVFTPANSTTSTTRLVLSGTDANNAAVINVYDGNYNLLGTLPNTTRAVVLYQDATPHVFAYTYDSASSQVLRYDLTASQSGGAYSSIASAPAANPGANVRMAISPDGGTLFIAGSSQIVVQPAP